LQTDYLDLYQLHWPERNQYFRSACFTLQDDEWEDIHEVLTTLDGFIKEGKIKHRIIERKSMGYYAFLEENKYHNLPSKTIQNPYSL
jgi:aryl-alcohol dehydrogenase-like predicted oxidoreductase